MSSRQTELTTFGAMMRFAVSLEEDAAERYESWAERVGEPEAATLQELAASHRKRAARLGRMVQEELNEMTLEPIQGLRAEDYPIGPDPPDGASASDLAAFAASIEARLAGLYDDIVGRAGRVLGRAARRLERLAKQSRADSERLR
jgi:rubrerythrin